MDYRSLPPCRLAALPPRVQWACVRSCMLFRVVQAVLFGRLDGGMSRGVSVENTLKSREHILEQLEGFPGELERVIFAEHVSDEDILKPGSDGGWGIAEILPHLRDWEAIYLERAHMIVDEDNPHIPGYDDSLWPIERDYRAQNPEDVFEEFQSLRAEHVAYLKSLPVDVWTRTGDHSLWGQITLHWMENYISNHDRDHLNQARDVLVG